MAIDILITGDMVADRYLYEAQRVLPGSSVRTGAASRRVLGGAGLLFGVLDELARRKPVAESAAIQVRAGFVDEPGDAGMLRSFVVMQPCPRTNKEEKELKEKVPKVWRLTQPLGVESPPTSPGSSPDNAAAGQAPIVSVTPSLDEPHDIVVIDDANLGFRRWVNRSRWPKFLRPDSPGDIDPALLPAWIVLKSAGPLAAGNLWQTLISGQTQHDTGTEQQRNQETGKETQQVVPKHFSIGELASRTVVVVSIEDLRLEGVRVDGQLSWEGAATSLIRDLNQHPHLQDLKKVRFLVVRFQLDGALIIDWADEANPRYRLLFDPSGTEGSFAKQYPPQGRVLGYQTAFTAAIVAKLADLTAPPESPTSMDSLVDGAATGLSTARRLLHEGHGPAASEEPTFPFRQIVDEISQPRWKFGSIDVPAEDNAGWTIVGGMTSKPLWGLARRVALNGIGELTSTPYLKFGKLFSVDRFEMESLRTLQRLLSHFQRDKKATKPLSIAAFGPPGSGKSFGVKQLATALFDDPKLLEFNLSQFEDASALNGLFHQIRDEVLRGKLPVVFWDEFDSRELKWLQYLLAPMQDGTFQEGQITHPIGKCVFVFAGGTRHRFEDFGVSPMVVNELARKRREHGKKLTEEQEQILEEEDQKWHDRFTLDKGPDFRSRLAGYLNVLGPNRNEHGETDLTYPVRRALLLRVHLGLGPNDPLQIDHGLLDAFLRVEKYKHGARSLEKIAEQVRHSSRHGVFTRSDVPPPHQLDLHVDAKDFLNILETT
ncbi:MAG: AAA family ATPase [Planctomycetaceae bacterium]